MSSNTTEVTYESLDNEIRDTLLDFVRCGRAGHRHRGRMTVAVGQWGGGSALRPAEAVRYDAPGRTRRGLADI